MKQYICTRLGNPGAITLMLLAFPFFIQAQGIAIHFDIKNSTTEYVEIIRGDHTHPDRLFKKEREILIPLVNGKGTWTDTLAHPRFAAAYYQDSVTRKYFSYIFYLSPEDNLTVSFDAKDPEMTYTVNGKGHRNNQPLIQKVINNRPNLKAYEKDSLPGNVFQAIRKRSSLNQRLLAEYISKNSPTKEFERIYSVYAQYFPAFTYIDFKGDQKFNIRQPYMRNEEKWQAIEDSLTNVISINNTEMLGINEYDYFLSSYLTRIKERLWQHPELLREYYDTETQEEAVKLKNEDPENILKGKIIEKHFTGRTAEYLYGKLFQYAIGENEDNLPEIFMRFRQRYPESQYIPYIEPAIRKIEARRKRSLTAEMVFVEDNSSFQTFDEVLNLVKGKTVLLDMWGTWCGPCRSELSRNSDTIKIHFENMGLTYLYIANYDVTNEAKWKELISYYNLTGIHILASKELTKDIMKRTGGTGFPTYVIIKKDGTFELSAAGYPMEREILIGQLENALAH